MANMNLKDALEKSLLATKKYIDDGMIIEVDDLELQILQSNEENLICDVWLTDEYSSTILKTNIDDMFILNDNITEVKAQNYLYCDGGSKVRIESISLENDNFVWETAFLRKIDFIEKFDLGSTTSLADLYNAYRNPRITFPLFDTKNVTDMKSMFSNCSSLTSVPHYNTSKVENMNSMFYNCSSLTSVPHFDTSKVTDIGWLFASCSSLTSVPQFDTSSATNMDYMFYGCSSLVSISHSDTSKVENMNYMFYNCTSLENIYNLNVSSCTKFSKLFDSCNKLKYVELISTDASKITSVVNTLPTHVGADADAYIIDISKCSSDVISALSGLTRNGWTIKTIV